MKLVRFPIVWLILVVNAFAQEKQLPTESKELTDKLSAWELDLQAEMQQEIRAKRNEVIELLEKHLESATRSGDLDGAIAIRAKIQELRPKKKDQTEIETSPTATSKSKIPEDAIEHEGKLYAVIYSDEQMTFRDAQREARKLGGEIALLDNKQPKGLIAAAHTEVVSIWAFIREGDEQVEGLMKYRGGLYGSEEAKSGMLPGFVCVWSKSEG